MAKVVIRDVRLGEVDLRVNMNGEGRIQVEINAADPRVREELEKGIEDLRSSLEKSHLSVADIKVTGEARKADTGSGEGAPRDPWQQGQSQQGMLGGSRQQGNTPQDGSQDWAFGSPQQGSSAGGGKKSSPVDNPAPALRQRIVQRGENGSLKVFA